MSTKFYSLLCLIFATCAGFLWLGNVFTILTAVVI